MCWGNLIKKLRDPGEAIEEIYPRKLWESRFKGRAFDADKVFFPERSNDGTENAAKSESPFRVALGISSGSSENSELNKVITESEAWKEALRQWMLFIPKINPDEEE